jgi:hypothetical protein
MTKNIGVYTEILSVYLSKIHRLYRRKLKRLASFNQQFSKNFKLYFDGISFRFSFKNREI